MGICYIIGPCGNAPAKIEKKSDDLVIAVDKGYLMLSSYGVSADIAVGDFDSLGYVPEDIPTLEHPVRKDDTDSALAVKYAMERGYQTFVIFGCVGGEREDHTLANLSLLAFIANRGCQGYLAGDTHAYTAIRNSYVKFSSDNLGTLSVFSMTEKCSGVYERGLSYTLEDSELFFDVALGVSNSFIGEKSEIGVGEGMLLVCWDTDHVKLLKTVEDNEKRY